MCVPVMDEMRQRSLSLRLLPDPPVCNGRPPMATAVSHHAMIDATDSNNNTAFFQLFAVQKWDKKQTRR